MEFLWHAVLDIINAYLFLDYLHAFILADSLRTDLYFIILSSISETFSYCECVWCMPFSALTLLIDWPVKVLRHRF